MFKKLKFFHFSLNLLKHSLIENFFCLKNIKTKVLFLMNYCLILDIFMYQKKSMKICDEDLFKNNLLSSSVNEMFCPK